ncbi:MAG: hypothetical protein ABSH32_32325 [Bryobacteraceae bacterium]
MGNEERILHGPGMTIEAMTPLVAGADSGWSGDEPGRGGATSGWDT